MLLRELDTRGRVPGADVGTIAEALDSIRSLEADDYLESGDSGGR